MIQAHRGRVLVHRVTTKLEQSKDSLLVLPETIVERPTPFALVISSGSLKHSERLKPGDMVILGDYAGAPVEVTMDDGTTIEGHFVNEDDVLAVIEP